MPRNITAAHRDAGLTLVEVLAAVVLLALLMVPLLWFVKQVELQWRRNAQEQTATELAREVIANAVSQGASSVSGTAQATLPTQGGFNTTYTIRVTKTPWDGNLTYLGVTVSWNSVSMAGGPVTQSVSVNQLVGP